MKSIYSYLAIFNSRKMVAILLLGFASGLPSVLADDAFRAWLTKTGFDLKTIGWLSLVGLPYSLKFLWSPLIDRFRLPWLGRRRSWILATQIGLMFAILGLASQMGRDRGLDTAGRDSALQSIAITAVAIAFLSATQDLAIDAMGTDLLGKLEVGAGASVALWGYRVALLLTGWIAFVLADRIGWAAVYSVMAGCLAIGRDLIAGPAAGEIAAQFGVGTSVAGLVYWSGFFLVTIIIAIPGMVMLSFMAPWNAKSSENPIV